MQTVYFSNSIIISNEKPKQNLVDYDPIDHDDTGTLKKNRERNGMEPILSGNEILCMYVYALL